MKIGVTLTPDKPPQPFVGVDEEMDVYEDEDEEDSQVSASSTISITLDDLTIVEADGSQLVPYMP